MDEFRSSPEEQLNSVPGEQEFSLEEIMEEFSGPEEEEEVKIWAPKERPAAQPATDHTIVLPTVEEPAEAPEEPPVEEPIEEPERPRIFRRPAPEPEEPVEEVPPPPPPTPEEAMEHYVRQRSRTTLPAVLSWLLLALVAAASVLVAYPQWPVSAYVPLDLYNLAALGALAVHAVLALRVLAGGVRDLLRLRFTPRTLVTLTAVVTLLDGILCIGSDRPCLCAAGSLLLTVALWSERLLLTGKARSLGGALAMDKPMAAARYRAVWNGTDGLYRRPADTEHLVEELEQTPGTAKALRIACPILAGLTLAIAIFAAVRGHRDFLWAWSALLLCACPLGGLLAYERTYCRLSKSLLRAGAVITGWAGAKRLCGSTCVVITDSDLFPKGALSMHGIKIFGDGTSEQLLGYAAALLERAGAGTAQLFDETLQSQNGRRYRAENFRLYDAGGMGGDVCGQSVLLGSRNFMRIMGVYIEKEANVADALYLSVGGELAALFAVTYKASEAVRSGLSALLGSRGLTSLLATRDVLLTPENVERKYHLPKERLEFPVSKDRMELLTAAEGPGEQGALLARDSFLGFSLAIAGARYLRRRAKITVGLSIFAAGLGLLLAGLLVLLGSAGSVSPLSLLLFHCIWLIPSGLLTR